MKLDGFGIFVNNMPLMIKFYQDVLGFEIKEKDDAENVYLKKDDTVFMLYRRSDFEKMTNSRFEYAGGVNGHFEIALSVENFSEVNKAYNNVTSKGALSVMPPVTMPWGQRTCYVSDPEGNLIEIGSFVP